MKKRKLTAKQQKFVDCYAGNATEAARLAGYKGGENALRVAGARLLTNANVCRAIEARQKGERSKLIATRAERQEFLTAVIRNTLDDDSAELKDRLKAVELLGRSEGDFLERHDVTNSDGSMGSAAANALQAFLNARDHESD